MSDFLNLSALHRHLIITKYPFHSQLISYSTYVYCNLRDVLQDVYKIYFMTFNANLI